MARSTSCALALVITLAACTTPDGPSARDERSGDLINLRIEETPRPGVFRTEALGARVTGDADGLWAAVANLPRPESAQIVNLATGSRVTVALFASDAATLQDRIALSPAAAEALGIGSTPVPVRVIAVRREPRLVEPDDVF